MKGRNNVYIYQELERTRKRKRILGIFLTFIFAVIGSYLIQTYLTNRIGSEGNNVERLANYNESGDSVKKVTKREDIIENVMKSVVGISVMKANEESLFDIELAEKWGLRHWYSCF